MKSVIFCTNLPSPYRVDFFNEFGKYCNLIVLYERHSSSERDVKWKGNNAKNFEEVYLDLKPIGVDQSYGSALRKYIASQIYDVLIFTNYASPAVMEAIVYCRLTSKPYYIEYDGGFNKKDYLHKKIIKQLLLGGAIGHLSSAKEHILYLQNIGLPKERIFKYPFTSISNDDIKKAQLYKSKGKSYFKEKLGIKEERMLLSVGRFSYERGYGKGYDILMRISKTLDNSIGIYIVGDIPTQEFVKWKEKETLNNIHFIGFKKKEELLDYYAAADLFVLLTRGDVWGLVINEAMAFSLPIITTDKCVAGGELIQNDRNGYIVELNNIVRIKERIESIILDCDRANQFGVYSLEIIKNYTFECMVKSHLKILNINP